MGEKNNLIAGAEKKLRYISADIKRNGRKILENYPITPPQFVALQYILEEEDLTIGQLSKIIGFPFSTTTDLIDRMEKNNLVKRTQDETDRRVIRISILEEGKLIIKEVLYERQKYLGEVLVDFSNDDKKELNALLQQIKEKMSEKIEK